MRGTPIQAAVAAARAFDAHRGSNERIAVIDFNRTAHVSVPLTAYESVIQPALASPPQLRLGTHINDAVVAALHLLDHGHVSGGTIVVLSDGADTGSKLTASAAAQRATAQHVRIFTVGLHSRDFSPRTLRVLANGSGGDFAEASFERAAHPDLRRVECEARESVRHPLPVAARPEPGGARPRSGCRHSERGHGRVSDARSPGSRTRVVQASRADDLLRVGGRDAARRAAGRRVDRRRDRAGAAASAADRPCPRGRVRHGRKDPRATTASGSPFESSAVSRSRSRTWAVGRGSRTTSRLPGSRCRPSRSSCGR